MKIQDSLTKAIDKIIPKKEQEAFINSAIKKGLENYKADHAEVIEVFVDGGSRGNPGPAGGGFGIYRGGKLVKKGSEYFGEKTNNQAEYLALRLALRETYDKFKDLKIHCYMDSQLVVEQMNGNFKVKSADLRPIFEETRRIADQFKHFQIEHIRREQNQLADQMANDAMDRRK
ncbi:ribonuclease HI family protein [Patescibacteria group bacterium]|nr:ribonuclease HI family protein [Patescibacteria group bacterium]